MAHLEPGDVWLFARVDIVIYVRTEDFFTLAELSLLLPSHIGVVAQVCVVLCHSERHGHLHAVCGVSESKKEQHKRIHFESGRIYYSM